MESPPEAILLWKDLLSHFHLGANDYDPIFEVFSFLVKPVILGLPCLDEPQGSLNLGEIPSFPSALDLLFETFWPEIIGVSFRFDCEDSLLSPS
jgi:hypothetical protein